MPEYHKGADSIYDIQYHVVWVTKYRYQVLKGEMALRARGYYCAIEGTVTDEQIRAYIERHKQEPFPDNFKIDT